MFDISSLMSFAMGTNFGKNALSQGLQFIMTHICTVEGRARLSSISTKYLTPNEESALKRCLDGCASEVDVKQVSSLLSALLELLAKKGNM